MTKPPMDLVRIPGIPIMHCCSRLETLLNSGGFTVRPEGVSDDQAQRIREDSRGGGDSRRLAEYAALMGGGREDSGAAEPGERLSPFREKGPRCVPKLS